MMIEVNIEFFRNIGTDSVTATRLDYNEKERN